MDENCGVLRLPVQAEVTYEWLRGTHDDGHYLSPSRLLMNKRKLRSVMVKFCLLLPPSRVMHDCSVNELHALSVPWRQQQHRIVQACAC